MDAPGLRSMSPRQRTVTQAGLLLLAGLLVAALHSWHELDSDEGVILADAWQLRHGLHPYTEFFEIIAPDSMYLVHWAWLALGPAYWVAKLVGACALGVAALGVWRLARAALQADAAPGLGTLPAVPALLFCLLSGYWQTINHNTFSLPFAVWSSVFAACALDSGRRRDAIASGVLAGLTVLFLQHRGAALVAALLLALSCSPGRRRCAPAFVLGVAAGAAPLLCWPIGSIVAHLVLFPLRHYIQVNRIPPVLPALALGAWLAAAWTLRHRRNGAATLLLLLQPVLLAATQRADPAHVTQNLFPLLALLPALAACRPATSNGRSVRRLPLLLVLAAVLLLLLLPFVPARWSDDGRLRQDTIQAVATACAGSDYLYADPFIPEFYFETGKRAPTRHALLLTGFNTPAQFEAAAADLARAAPPCALTAYGMVDKFGYRRDNPVDRYLADHYTPSGPPEHGLVLWRRRQP